MLRATSMSAAHTRRSAARRPSLPEGTDAIPGGQLHLHHRFKQTHIHVIHHCTQNLLYAPNPCYFVKKAESETPTATAWHMARINKDPSNLAKCGISRWSILPRSGVVVVVGVVNVVVRPKIGYNVSLDSQVWHAECANVTDDRQTDRQTTLRKNLQE